MDKSDVIRDVGVDFWRAFSFLDIVVSPSDLSFMKGNSKSEFFNQLQRPVVLVREGLLTRMLRSGKRTIPTSPLALNHVGETMLSISSRFCRYSARSPFS